MNSIADFLAILFRQLAGHRKELEGSGSMFPLDPADIVEEIKADEDSVFEPWEGPLERIPGSRREVYQVFGNPGTSKVDKRWERRSMVLVRDLPIIGKLYCHRLAEPYIREFLRRCELAGIAGEFIKLGCWSFRHQRHDPRRPLSDHSWGMAFDINPRQNRAKKFPDRNPPEPWSEEWLEIWPDGISEKMVLIAEAVGFESGVRWKGFVDPMHFALRTR